MNNQNNQDDDECFITEQTLQFKSSSGIHQSTDQAQYIKDILPEANQLKSYCRPTSIIPRIMSTQPDTYALPHAVNQACFQFILPDNSNQNGNISSNANVSTTKPKLNNKQKLSLADYLAKKEFFLVYNKFGNLNSTNPKKSINQMTIRLRTISQLTDYNERLFKQIQQIQHNLNISQDKLDSNFQSGNLCRAYCNVNYQNCYYLLLEQDTNTHGYSNWFFYRFRNTNKGLRKFFILNIVKKTIFYKQNMKISVFSLKKWKQSQQKTKWHKTGSNISFFQTNFLRQEHNDYFNCLYFQYDFQFQEDEVYFAINQPYTYTRMANLIKQLKSPKSFKSLENNQEQIFQDLSQKSTQENQNKCKSQNLNKTMEINWKTETVGYSISNNIIPSITFYANNTYQNKKTILFLGRQHPSQMAGSFLAEYLIKNLVNKKPSQQVQFLLNKFNITIIPMVNPDGVIYGNSRSNLAGLDLNRHWGVDLIKQLTPQTHKIRSQLTNLEKSNRNIKFLLDLHGHGKKLNSFLFCCKKQDRVSNRYFPLIISKLQERFDLVSCTYGISKDKQNTIRAQLYDIGISDCYTLQNSYYGYNKKVANSNINNNANNQVKCYNQNDYNELALSLLKSLFIFFSSEKQQKQIVKQKFGFNIDTVNEQLMKIVDKLQRQQKNMINDQDIMSESDPQGDGLKLQERLKICNNSKVLDKKIRETFRKKNIQKSSTQKKKRNKNQKAKTQPAEQQKHSSQEDIKILQKKIQGKLVMSKKLKIQNKIKITSRQRRSMMQTKRPQQQSKIIRKLLNRSFNPFKIPSQQPLSLYSNKFIHSLYSVQDKTNSKTNIQKTKPFDKCKIFQKIKTQIQQNHSFSLTEIEKQNERKEKIQQRLTKLKQQNLKNMVKQSLLFMDCTIKSRKCKFIQQKKSKNRLSNHLIDARLHSYSVNMDKSDQSDDGGNQAHQSQNNLFKSQKSQVNMDKNKVLVKTGETVILKTFSQEKKTRAKRSYQRFQAFARNSPALNKMMGDTKKPGFYYFPIM